MILKKWHAYKHVTYSVSKSGTRKKVISNSVTVPIKTEEWPGEWHHWEECQQCRAEQFKPKEQS